MDKSKDTKIRILDAAEQLFAEQGYASTSLRNITADAGVNLASVNYHFGTKEALLGEVLARRLGPINEERIRLLDEIELEAGDAVPELEEVIRAFLFPAFQAFHDSGERGAQFMQLIGRTHSETNEQIRNVFLDLFRDVIQRFTQSFQRVFPDLTEEEVRLRVFFLVGAMAHTLIFSHKVSWLPRGDESRTVIYETLVQFVTAGMRARVPTLAQGRTS
jgi:AcrR family transcriptional regulator